MAQNSLFAKRGAIAEDLGLEVVRELTLEDMNKLAQAPKTGVPVIQRLKATHHKQAMLLAQGHSVKEIAAIVGCSAQRVVQLQNDPTFAELVTYYHDQIITNMLTDASRLQDKIVNVGEMAVDELEERLENDESRKRISIGEIRKIAEFAMDRTVAPPKAAPMTNTVPSAVTINFGTPISLNQNDEPKTIEGNSSSEESE